jgi:hypothetical protein
MHIKDNETDPSGVVPRAVCFLACLPKKDDFQNTTCFLYLRILFFTSFTRIEIMNHIEEIKTNESIPQKRIKKNKKEEKLVVWEGWGVACLLDETIFMLTANNFST